MLEESFVLDTNEAFYVNSDINIVIHSNHFEIVAYHGETVYGVEITFNPAESKLLKKINPKTVTVLVNNLNFTLIPQDLFIEENLPQYLSFTNGTEISKAELFNLNYQLQLSICFTVDANKLSALKAMYPAIQVKHCATDLIANANNGVIIKFVGENMFVSVMDNNKLVFLNGYPINSQEETLYYLSLICEKLKLKFTETQFKVDFGKQNQHLLKFWKDYIPEKNLITTNKGLESVSSELKNKNIYPEIA